jgi:hypothetical protein
VHPQIAAVGDRRPIRGGQIGAGKKLDLEGCARNAFTPRQINDSHAYALFPCCECHHPMAQTLADEAPLGRESWQ